MKNKLTTLDIVSLVKELQPMLLGLRVDQVYDVDKKTYLIRLTKTDVKMVLVLESGIRFHTTGFDWPKHPAPSGFTMKLRKHLNNKRLEKITQLGADRIVDFQFGSDVVAHHIILELYDRGNIILTDNNYEILSLLRKRIEGEERLAAHSRYAVEKAKQNFSLPLADVQQLVKSESGKALRHIFLSKVEFGPALFSHVLAAENMELTTKIPTGEANEEFAAKLFKALESGRAILENFSPDGGFIVQSSGKKDKNKDKTAEEITKTEETSKADSPVFYDQFHPAVLLPDFQNAETLSFPSLNAAVDIFFSEIESQKSEMKQIHQREDALKKLEKVKLDQTKRLLELQIGQETDKRKAELISVNQVLVDSVISAIRQLVANQIPWDDIWEQIQEAKENGDPLASTIVKLNLIKNQFTISLRDPYETPDPDNEPSLTSIDIDLGLSAYANATKYYDLKRQSAKKEERTLESQDKAFKSTEKRTMKALKEVATIHLIKKARKVYWFEKFRWFISSENYLVLAGRDAQQNELLVKRYLRPKDVYLHADAHGAPTVLIKNDVPEQLVLPKTLNEAGIFAIAQSGSWESKVVTTAWWVFGEQVSKSAPTGEYLPTGSFMVRGKKNYLPPTQLVLGFGFLFRLTEESLQSHKSERSRRLLSTGSTHDQKDDSRKSSTEDIDLPDEEEDEEDESEFPDTQVKINLQGSSNRVRTQTLSTMSVSSANTCFSESIPDEIDESQHVIVINSGVAPVVISAQKLKRDKKRADKKGHDNVKNESNAPVKEEHTGTANETQPQKPKRGQHGRNKKIKEKYRFQDEEERAQRMLLLRGGDASATGGKKGKKKNANASPMKQNQTTKLSQDKSEKLEPSGGDRVASLVEEASKPTDNVPDSTPENVTETNEPEGTEEPREKPEEITPPEEPEEEEEEEEEGTQEAETNVLNGLTGTPKEDDELLFAVPVVAPYSTLHSYKFKIKMVPGNTKRGKAARSALEYFLRDKSANQREKDLLKSVKDQDLARNFPGKVKISTHDKR